MENITNPIVTTKKLTASGNSLVINVTNEVKLMGLAHGDTVAVRLDRVDAE